MIVLYFRLAFAVHAFLQRHAPTNRLVRAVLRRTGPTWLPLAALFVGIGYLLATRICASAVEHNGPGLINLLVLLFAWNAIKLMASGSIGLARLGGVYLAERVPTAAGTRAGGRLPMT